MEPFSQLDIKVIRQDTRLVQRISIDQAHQGELNGEVFFVLEPLCMPFRTSVLLRKSTEDGQWFVASVTPLSEHPSMRQGRCFLAVRNEKVAIPCVQPTLEEKHGHRQEDCGGFVGQGVPRFDAQGSAEQDGGHHKA